MGKNSELYIDLAKLILQMFFSLASQGNATPEQVNAMLVEERAKFNLNKPEDLPDV